MRGGAHEVGQKAEGGGDLSITATEARSRATWEYLKRTWSMWSTNISYGRKADTQYVVCWPVTLLPDCRLGKKQNATTRPLHKEDPVTEPKP